MALNLINSVNSFVRFGDTVPVHCIWGAIDYCLPVYDQEDVYFQFVIEGTLEEIDMLCTNDASEVEVSIVDECDTEPLLIFSQKPQRFRLSDTQVLYNWTHGVPFFESVVEIDKCFKLQVELTTVYETVTFCSNCFERIGDPCFTSVIEYGNEEDGFGFKYCYAGDLATDRLTEECEPTIVQFINEAALVIPYTAMLQDKHGDVPTVQVWVYDNTGQLINMSITAGFDTYPPTLINLDFGGTSSGIVILR